MKYEPQEFPVREKLIELERRHPQAQWLGEFDATLDFARNGDDNDKVSFASYLTELVERFSSGGERPPVLVLDIIKDFLKNSFEVYQDTAERGHPLAMLMTARYYIDGDVVPSDLAQARLWLDKAEAVAQAEVIDQLGETQALEHFMSEINGARLDILRADPASTLEDFDPAPDAPPRWQDLIAADGRLEKLLKRLEGLPHVSLEQQKEALAASCGLKIMPALRELIKYGLNDNDLTHTGYCVSLEGLHQALKKNGMDYRTKTIRLNPDGNAVDPDNNNILAERQTLALSMSGWHRIEENYQDNGHADPTEIAFKIMEALYDWTIQDVAPAVPNIILYYTAQPEADGGLTLTFNQNAGWSAMGPEKYFILAEGYKGTRPSYDPRSKAGNTPAPPKP